MYKESADIESALSFMHLLTKPQQAGDARPYDMDFSADENST